MRDRPLFRERRLLKKTVVATAAAGVAVGLALGYALEASGGGA